ncbi:MAG: tRNA adenosine(34) deaminase TadA [Desulfobacterales bacterium]|nr:tRNA adenosine(34) deaminase TadA [Desulfobacterales bacterium]MDD4071294.1 tRNA adenosine(34) deaminase TadA [Desulfobacterales bacterium]MDD4393313.1 tRNA adenosine(34) deaminase TadA [Desulfobacterales bacterium]
MNSMHQTYMKLALQEAAKAGQIQEVPVGALLVSGSGEVLSAAHNQTIFLSDPSAHAEILALRQAASAIGNYRLLNTTLYVTIEPCLMCMGAIIHARVARVVFGAHDLKWGAAGSLYNLASDSRLNHQPEIISGVCEEECRTLIQDFFRSRRKQAVMTQ